MEAVHLEYSLLGVSVGSSPKFTKVFPGWRGSPLGVAWNWTCVAVSSEPRLFLSSTEKSTYLSVFPLRKSSTSMS